MEKLRRLVVLIYIVCTIISIMFISDRDFHLIKYGQPEEAIPWLFMFFSSLISIYFIGIKNKCNNNLQNIVSLWLKRKRLEEQKRIKELEK